MEEYIYNDYENLKGMDKEKSFEENFDDNIYLLTELEPPNFF